MSREILALAEALASEKNVDPNVVFEALETALGIAAKKKADREHMNLEVRIHRETGEYKTVRKWLIVEDLDYTYPELEKTIEQIQEEQPGIEIEVGDYYEEEIPNEAFGRQAAQTAKQIILQKIRDAEREQILNGFLANREDVVVGTVKRVERHGIVVEIAPKLDALIPREHMLPRENYRGGDKIRALFLKVEEFNGGRKQVMLSRASTEFLRKLFEQEVPEIRDGILEIREVARDPGQRAKIAVHTNDQRIDPQGTCIGVRGSRVNAVSNEIGGERIDVVLWSDDTAQFVINALSPAQVSRIVINDEMQSVDVIVAEDQLALAIGRGGQNVRLAAELTGLQLNIMTEQEAEQRNAEEELALRDLFMSQLGADESVALALVAAEFTSIEEVAFVPMSDLTDLDGVDDALAESLRNKAREVLLQTELEAEEKLNSIADDLRNLDGLDDDMLRDLVDANITNRDDLAELSIDELIEITGVSKEEAEQVILTARAHWFADDAE
ncbi:transcription termination factor NusA [Kingella kingae]|uniref:transcription termination factor NusA n=1 Tax=Kingella kingae TaxID=504 RepID=UPI0013E01295|nr:transcription termination factor NusA [Kingella kingae]MBD3613675.1 transcription termination/antitermination protein NusA [Kingella kingae]MBD3631986.1 transcription termination/antitermination protein NusA [Kingella kingae]MBD3659306.1 transcription termination/antitermination protein NusA [Kingella kingae]MDK4586648.1 transcription termination factor NusA [Kingella kingae]MDK4604249.1 transcription termination factor NusA [Kingella kingae]